MRYQSAAAFRQALETRLRQAVRDHGAPLSMVRKMVVFERLVARLMQVSPDGWIVKGGAALVFRAGFDAHTTRDLDLGRRGTIDAAIRDMDVLQTLDSDDYFAFTVTRDAEPLPIQEAQVVRFAVTADLDG